MNVTFNSPGALQVRPEHIQENGRVMVYLDSDGIHRAGLFWLTPDQAAQWIEALTPLAATEPTA